MSIDLIAAGVLVVALIGIAFVIIRKLPVLAAIDVAATTTVAEKKANLLEQRLRRKISDRFKKVVQRGRPVMQRSRGFVGQAQRKLVDLQKEYRARSLPVLLNRRQQRKLQSEVKTILEQARSFLNEEEYGAAEERALHAVRLEPRSVPAFEILSEVYLATKEHQHAREVYQYLLKLAEESDAIFAHPSEVTEAPTEGLPSVADVNGTVMRYHLELAQVERELNNWDKAFEQIKAAEQLEPNNPKVLDELIEISLGFGKKQSAEEALRKISESNPDNKKIPEWQERITAL